jgi:uncharacterized membrane protein YsdA (DUF1294 family)/cold shock CspA family protein
MMKNKDESTHNLPGLQIGDFGPHWNTNHNETFAQASEAPMVRLGRIAQWQDDKGYGWVKSGDKRWFLHIKEFERAERRPQSGEEVRFIPGTDSKGRDCAKRVTFVKSGGRVGMGGWVVLFGLLVLPALAALKLPLPWWVTPVAMMLISAVTYRRYAHDKQQAVAAGWRVPEVSLHLTELLGGWPGAFLAQRRLRHKCTKASYQTIFWIIILIYQLAAADVLYGHRLSTLAVNRVSQVIRQDGPVPKPSPPADVAQPTIIKLRKNSKPSPHESMPRQPIRRPQQ